MSLIRRGNGNHKTRIRAVLTTILVVIIAALVFILNISHTDSLLQTQQNYKTSTMASTTNNKKSPSSISKKNNNPQKKPTPKTATIRQTAQLQTPSLAIKANNGVYNGPGAVLAHNSFEQWLNSPVLYATDYIDYKGGWNKDFIDSNAWLAKPWSDWVKAKPGRRLVLGLPMLENENSGQFDQGTNGAFDQYFINLGNSLVYSGLGNSIVRLGYEANCNTIGPWQATDNPAGYKNLFRHIVTIMRGIPGSSFSFDWTVCNGLQNGHPLNSFDSFYPGDDVVDINGMDIYDVKWQDPAATPQQRWDYLLSRRLGINDFVHFAQAHNKPVSFPEWGLYKLGDSFAGGGDNPYFINKMAGLMASTNPVYQSYFNLDWGGGKLFDFGLGKETYRQIFGSKN
jgi:hypothetical protein